MARIWIALKTALLAGPALATHPCLEREAIAPGAREVAPAAIVWAGGAATPDLSGVLVSPIARAPDRYDRWIGFAVAPDAERPLQIDWLRAGLGYADPVGLQAACADALLAAEAEARAARRGLWRRQGIERAADPTLAGRTGGFAIVEGRIVSVGDRARTLYLNFGTFWRQDFTVRIDKRDLKRHPELLARLTRAEGRTIRVRGALTLRDGPFMRVRDAGQIEFPVAERATRGPKRAGGG